MTVLLFAALFLAGCVHQQQPASVSQPLSVEQPAPLENNQSNLTSPPVENVTVEEAEIVQEPLQDTMVNNSIKGFDAFYGVEINTAKFSLKSSGPGTIVQNEKIIQSGTALNQIVWNTLYSNEKIDLSKDVRIEVEIDLTGSIPSGEALAIVGIEENSTTTAGEKPTRSYCEVSLSSTGARLRMQNSTPQNLGFTTVGKMTLFYSSATSTLTCSFAGVTISEVVQPLQQHVLTLRSALHLLSSDGKEEGGTGSFTAKFDDLYIS